jgi:electron transport complex protein RnfC
VKLRAKGIRPYRTVDPDFSRPIWQASLPPEAVVPLLQHQGAEATALVQKGDEVREGLLVGKASERGGAGVHSPIPGVVQGIIDITLPDGQECKAVSIKLKGQFDYLGKQKTEEDWQSMSPLAIIDLAGEKGLVHMDGFTEPLGGTLGDLRKHGAGTIVINAASGAPFVSSEIRLINEYPAQIAKGIDVLRRVLSTDDVWFVYPRRHASLIRPFKDELQRRGGGVRFKALRDSFSSGDPYELIHMVTGKELLPQAGYASSGAGVFAASTVFALYEAVVLKKALVDRLITIGGGAMGPTRTVRVRIGTAIGTVFGELGGIQRPPAKILVGNPLQGYEVADATTPVTKQISAVFALTEAELGQAPQQPCINCGICVNSCPADLEPVTLHKLLMNRRLDDARDAGLLACRVCGICSHVCPSRIPLTQSLRDGIVDLTERGDTID